MVREEFDKHPKSVTAWVIGIGGITEIRGSKTQDEPYKGTEHLEMAHAFENAGVKEYQVHVIEPSHQALRFAKENIGKDHIVLWNNLKHHQGDLEGRKAYLRTLGLSLDHDRFEWKIPPHVRNRIIFHGPEKSGNILLTLPRLRPDVVTAFNISRYYEPQTQKFLGESLADSLNHGGVLLTGNDRAQKEFLDALREKLGIEEKTIHIPMNPEESNILMFRRRD